MSLQSSGNWKSGRWGESTMGRAGGGGVQNLGTCLMWQRLVSSPGYLSKESFVQECDGFKNMSTDPLLFLPSRGGGQFSFS